MVDPIADMLTRIRNAIAVNKSEVNVPHSKTKAAVAETLKANGYIVSYESSGDLPRLLTLQLREPKQTYKINEIHRVSKPGRRVYVTADKIPVVLRGRGMVVLSTSSGIVDGAQARTAGVGGELMFKVW